MSNYDQWRDTHNYARGTIDAGSTGSGLLWLFVAVALLGLIVLVGSLGGGSSIVEHPGGAGAEAVIVPAEPDAGSSGAADAPAAGTVVE